MAISPVDVTGILQQHELNRNRIQQTQAQTQEILQGQADEAGFRSDMAKVDPAMDFMSKLETAQGIALSHGQFTKAEQMANVIGTLSYKKEQMAHMQAQSAQAQATADDKARKDIISTVGSASTEAEWNGQRMLALATNPNISPELKNFLQQPWTPELGKTLAKVSVSPQEAAKMESERALTAARRAQAEDAIARARSERALLQPKIDSEVAKAANLRSEKVVREAKEADRAQIDGAKIKAGGTNVGKLSEATNGDKKDAAATLKMMRPELKGADAEGAIATLSQEAKEFQLRNKGSYSDALRKVTALAAGQFFNEGGKAKFRPLPLGVPAGAKIIGKSAAGNYVWETTDGRKLEE